MTKINHLSGHEHAGRRPVRQFGRVPQRDGAPVRLEDSGHLGESLRPEVVQFLVCGEGDGLGLLAGGKV